MNTLNSLVIQILRVIRLREEEPAFRDQPRILDDKGQHEQSEGTAGQTRTQEDDRYRESKHQEYPLDAFEHRRSGVVEVFASIE